MTDKKNPLGIKSSGFLHLPVGRATLIAVPWVVFVLVFGMWLKTRDSLATSYVELAVAEQKLVNLQEQQKTGLMAVSTLGEWEGWKTCGGKLAPLMEMLTQLPSGERLQSIQFDQMLCSRPLPSSWSRIHMDQGLQQTCNVLIGLQDTDGEFSLEDRTKLLSLFNNQLPGNYHIEDVGREDELGEIDISRWEVYAEYEPEWTWQPSGADEWLINCGLNKQDK